MILKGSITTLRPINIEDAEVTLRWRKSPRAKLMQKGAQTIAEQMSWIRSKMVLDEFNLIIEYMGKSVGMIALHDINKQHNHAILGRLLIGEQEFVGKAPVSYEAELLLSDYAFDVVKVHKIYGDVVGKNVQVLNLRKYLGYKKDGILRDHFFYEGEYLDIHNYSLLESEYRKECRPKLIQLTQVMGTYS